MAKKKTTIRSKWRLAGEVLTPATLSESEERLLSDIFSDFQTFVMTESAFGIHAGTMRGRETAVRACAGYFCERFGEAYGRETVIKALSTAVALPVSPDDFSPESNSILLGAALWLLDYAERRNLQTELLPLLPEDYAADIELLVPFVEDFRYSKDLIYRLMTVLLNRKTNTLREFRKIVGLIRKDDAAKLRGAFREILMDYFDRFLEVCKRVTPSPSPDVAPALTPPPSAKDLFSVGKSRTPPPSLKDIPERTPDVAFLIKTPGLIGLPPEKMRSELYYRRMTDLLSAFTVRNPYEICAGSVLLEREDDVLMNLNTLTNATLACTERYLPWALTYGGKLPTLYEGGQIDYALSYPFQKPSGADEEKSDEDDAPEGELFSEEQLFYMATGYLLPRDRRPSEALNAWFLGQGLSEARSRGLTMAAMAFSVSDDARTDAEDGAWEIGGDASKGAPGEARDERREADAAERIADLTRQLKSAKQSAHDKEQLIRQLEEQLRDEQSRAEQDRMELRGLRDTLFRTRAGEIPEFAAVENQIQFPWQIRRRVLIFGGHDTWSKSIRPLLPGARFFQRESLPDLNAIKGADVVWIQANALSHKFYYRIIETARRENIPVRYFGFASARKCAEQVVENELSEGSDA